MPFVVALLGLLLDNTLVTVVDSSLCHPALSKYMVSLTSSHVIDTNPASIGRVVSAVVCYDHWLPYCQLRHPIGKLIIII